MDRTYVALGRKTNNHEKMLFNEDFNDYNVNSKVSTIGVFSTEVAIRSKRWAMIQVAVQK